MPRYTIIIEAVTDDEPTDLELGDVCLQLTDSLDSPVVERIDGTYGPADYSFEGWAIELFEETGQRVWLYTKNHPDPRQPAEEAPSPAPQETR